MSMPALSHWPWLRRWFGNRSERAAERYLKRKGYRILRRNYRCNSGELDLIALDGRTIVFAEVRSTASTQPDIPAQSIDLEKQRRMTRAALHFIRRHHLRDPSCRYDILILCWPPEQSSPRIEHYLHAFEAVGRFQMDH